MGAQDQMLEQIQHLKFIVRDLLIQHYAQREFLSGVWWLNVANLIIPLVIWYILVDKKRLMEIIIVGLVANVYAGFLDVLGSEMMLWDYPVHVLPVVPLLIPIDYIILPVIQMLLYQYFPNWRGFLIASVVASALQTFVAEPFAVWVGVYQLISWKYIYSFPIYILIGVSTKFFVERVMARQMRSRAKS